MFRKFAITTTALVLTSVAIAAASPTWAQDTPQPSGQAACGEQAKVTLEDRMYDRLSKETDLHWLQVERYTAHADKYRSQAAQYRDLAANARRNANATDNPVDKADWNKTADGHQANADKLEADAKAMDQRVEQEMEEARKSARAASAILEDCQRRQNAAALDQNQPQGVVGSEPSTPKQSADTPKKVEKTQKVSKPKIEKPKKQARLQKTRNATQDVAQSIARDVAVNVASQLILGEINGMGHKRKKHHKAERREMMTEGMAMEEFQPRRRMKIKKLMGVGFGMF
jgi:hypothetical protein